MLETATGFFNMKRWYLFLILCAFFFNRNTKAQPNANLVINPSFEELIDCPPGNGHHGIQYAKGWFSWFGDRIPGTAAPFFISVFTPCGDFWGDFNLWRVSPGFIINNLGYQKAQDGINYANFIGNYYEKTPATPAISGSLIKPLEPDRVYNIKFYVSLADRSFGTFVRNLTVMAHVDSNLQNWDVNNLQNSHMPFYRNFVDSIILSFDHPVHIIPTDWLNDTLNWVEVNGKFTAKGGERYFTIGKLQHSSEMVNDVILDVNPNNPGAYYYIDNVQIWAEPDPVIEEPKPPLQIPNVITPNQDGYNDYWQLQNIQEGTQVFIYNRWGTLVYQSNSYQNNWPEAGNVPSAGIYFYLVRTREGEEFKGSLTIING